MAGDQRSCSSSGLPQGHDRHKERHADEDGAGFQNSGGNEAQRGRFVLPLEHREQHDGGADAGESHDDLQDTADDGGSVRASADDVVRTVHRTVEKEGRDRDKGEQVEHARDKRGLSKWTHLKLLLFAVRSSTLIVHQLILTAIVYILKGNNVQFQELNLHRTVLMNRLEIYQGQISFLGRLPQAAWLNGVFDTLGIGLAGSDESYRE